MVPLYVQSSFYTSRLPQSPVSVALPALCIIFVLETLVALFVCFVDDEYKRANRASCDLPIARHWNSNDPRMLAARHGWWAFRHNCTASSNLPARTNEYND